MKGPIRLLLIDDHGLFRESLMRLLEAEPDLTVAGHCANLAAARALLTRNEIDVVLLDYDLGDELGSEFLRGRDLRKSPFKVLIVTAGMREKAMLAALHSGVTGVVFKHHGPRDLMEAIRRVANGEIWMDARIVHALISGVRDNQASRGDAKLLTNRQQAVLLRILDGFTNKDIAAQLGISESSVKATIQELFLKAGVRTRSQLVRIALEKYSAEWLSGKN